MFLSSSVLLLSSLYMLISQPCISCAKATKLNCITLMSDSMFSTTLTSLSTAACSFLHPLLSPFLYSPGLPLTECCVCIRVCLADKWMLGSNSDLEQSVDSLFTIFTFSLTLLFTPFISLLRRLAASLSSVRLSCKEILAYRCRKDLQNSQLMGF